MIIQRNRMRQDMASGGGDDDKLIPLINVVFLMLVFIMLVGTLAPADLLPIAAPKSSTSGERDRQPLQFAITADGQLWWRERSLDAAQLGAVLTELTEQPEPPEQSSSPVTGGADAAATQRVAVEIRADRAAGAGVLLELLTRLQQHGFYEIRLLTQAAP